MLGSAGAAQCYTGDILLGLMPGPEMNAVLDAVPCRGGGGAGPVFGGNVATSSTKAYFSHDLALSMELAYIDCIFLPMHRLCFLFPHKHKFSALCHFVTFQSV